MSVSLPLEEKHQVTVAELIAILSKLPQDAKVFVECDYAFHNCEGAHEERGAVYMDAG